MGGIDAAIGMRNKFHRQFVYAGIVFQRTVGELGQLAMEPVGQMPLRGADLFLNQMKIVQQPFRRRRYRLARQICPDDGAIGLRKNSGVVVKPLREETALLRAG